MDLADKIKMVKALSEETDDDIIAAFLGFAGTALWRYGDPFQTMEEEKFLELYPDVQVDYAAYKLNKRGWDYETSHSENGVSRIFETGDMPPSIMKRITPIASVVS